MNIFKRIKNLWFLSELEPFPQKESKSMWEDLQSALSKKKASVVDMIDPLSIDLGDE